MKHLTFKTVLLLALGSGECRSEVHAWLNKCIRHHSDWSKVSLNPSPSFFPMTSWPKRVQKVCFPGGDSSPDPTLHKSLKSDRSLCPVRVLHYYLDRTSRKVSTKISPATIFSWIKETVILCYELFDQEALTLHQVKAHDVRTFTAPKAFQSGISLEQILPPCLWH